MIGLRVIILRREVIVVLETTYDNSKRPTKTLI